MVNYCTISPPTTVKEQIRKYVLEVKDTNPSKAEKFATEITPLLSKDTFSTEQDIHDLSLVISQYMHGFHLYADLTEEVKSAIDHNHPRPLKTLTKVADTPYQVWKGKSRTVLWKAWREGRPTVVGYGMTEQEAVDELRYVIQPDHDGTLDGLGKPRGPTIGGNMRSQAFYQEHNRNQYAANPES